MCQELNCESNNKEILHSEEYINIQTGEKLDLERVEGLKGNAMLRVKPELWCIWDFEKNNNLGFNIWGVTKSMEKKVWWMCPKCNSDYDMVIGGKTHRNQGCPFCSRKRVNKSNSLASINP